MHKILSQYADFFKIHRIYDITFGSNLVKQDSVRNNLINKKFIIYQKKNDYNYEAYNTLLHQWPLRPIETLRPNITIKKCFIFLMEIVISFELSFCKSTFHFSSSRRSSTKTSWTTSSLKDHIRRPNDSHDNTSSQSVGSLLSWGCWYWKKLCQ